jgi:hypothetical protein
MVCPNCKKKVKKTNKKGVKIRGAHYRLTKVQMHKKCPEDVVRI